MQRRATLAAGVVALMAVLLVAAAPKPDGKVHAKVDAGLRVLEIKLGGAIAEKTSVAMPFGPRPKLLRDYTASIRKAAGDADIKAIVLQLSSPEVSLAQIQELGEALDEFKAAGKKVYCYTDICANRDYLVATHANHITLAPGGALVLVGLSAEVAFMKGLLDWAGIKVDVVHAGKHKAMGEPYSKEKMSDENRRVFNEFLDEMYEQFLGMIAKGRGITAAQARKLVDGGPYSAGGARVAKLIDSVGYYDQLVGRIGKDIGGKVALVKSYHRLGKKKPDLSQFNIFTLFASLRPKPPIPKTDRPKVVVIYATGPIVTGGTSSPLLGDVVTAKSIAGAFAAARK
ncbi:S49 family peptidase, partial [bacterium]|nr:S49 family peptidase [bacterium]